MNDSTAITIGLHTAGGKIREYTGVQDSRWIDCQKALNKAAFSIGITSSINNLEFQVIREFLESEFKDFSHAEISEAFSKYAALKLSFKEKPFNNMNNLFIANVLKSYRDFRNEIISKHRIELPKPAEKTKTDEENYKEIIEYINEKGKLPEWGSNIYLGAYRFTEPEMNLTIDEKKAFAAKVKESMERDILILREKGFSLTVRTGINELTNQMNDKVFFANHCRVLKIKEYLTNKFNLK